MNPYDFVPYPNGVPREQPTFRDVFDGHSGRLTCELEALAPVLIMDPGHRAGPTREELGTFITSGGEAQYVIPGTSLKGMLRSVAEVLSDSCVNTFAFKKTGHLVPQSMRSCQHNTHLCPACSTFGFLDRGEVLQGHVKISEATLVSAAVPMDPVQLVPLSTPDPRHQAFYGTSNNPAGRKFYFHHNTLSTASSQNDRDRGPWVAPLNKGVKFQFSVDFENLRDAYLDLLVAALTLSDAAPLGNKTVPVRHKLGYGKPAGMGSVAVKVTRVVLRSAGRYQSFKHTLDSLAEGTEELKSWVKEKQDRYFSNPSRPTAALIRILQYPPIEGQTYQYPTFEWFKANSQAPLSETP